MSRVRASDMAGTYSGTADPAGRICGEEGAGSTLRFLAEWAREQSRGMESFLDELRRFLTAQFDIIGYLLALKEEGGTFVLASSDANEGPGRIPEMAADSILVRFFQEHPEAYLSSRDPHAGGGSHELRHDALAALHRLRGQWCFPVQWNHAVVGLLVVRERRTAEPFSDEQLRFLAFALEMVGYEVQQLIISEQLQLIGSISKGLAHDLQTLLTPVLTCLQLLEGKDAEKAAQLAPFALKSLQTARTCLREGLAFAKNPMVGVSSVKLASIVETAVQLSGPRLQEKNLRADVEVDPELRAGMNETLMLRLVLNLLWNAIEAAPSDSNIQVQVHVEQREYREWRRIRVTNRGGSHPFKDEQRGAFLPEKAGYGLGLSICRKIAQLHGGTLQISMDPTAGATVELDIPAA